MCIAFYTLLDEHYSLVLATNRDEFLIRPTQLAHWHGRNDAILSGIDVTGGGTWFGIEKATGKWGLLTNVREEAPVGLRSRGKLVSDWLEPSTDLTIEKYLDTLSTSMMDYPGFNLLLGHISPATHTVELGFLSNRNDDVSIQLGSKENSSESLHKHSAECVRNLQDEEGTGVLSNGALACGLDKPKTGIEQNWPKMDTGRQPFRACLNRHAGRSQRNQLEAEKAFVADLLDSVLSLAPVTIRDKEDVRSSVLVTPFDMFPDASPNERRFKYATRAQTVLLVERQTGKVTFIEREGYRLAEVDVGNGADWSGRVKRWEFTIGPQ